MSTNQNPSRRYRPNRVDSSHSSGGVTPFSKIESVSRKGGYGNDTPSSHATAPEQAVDSALLVVADGPLEDISDEGLLSNEQGEQTDDDIPLLDSKAANKQLISILKKTKLDAVLSFKMEDRCINGQPANPYLKAWYAIMRVDGGCGQFLGPAVIKGLDTVKSWILSYILWNHTEVLAMHASSHPGGMGFAAAAEDLHKLRSKLHVQELAEDHAILFLERALLVLRDRNIRITKSRLLNQDNYDVESNSSGIRLSPIVPLYGSTVSSNSEDQMSSSSSACCESARSVCKRPEAMQMEQLSTTTLGQLIPLRCGHNGWPGEEELKAIKQWLELHYFLQPPDGK
jgi:hypothetical protein